MRFFPDLRIENMVVRDKSSTFIHNYDDFNARFTDKDESIYPQIAELESAIIFLSKKLKEKRDEKAANTKEYLGGPKCWKNYFCGE